RRRLTDVFAVEVADLAPGHQNFTYPRLGVSFFDGSAGADAHLLRVGIADHFGRRHRRHAQVFERGLAGVANLVSVVGSGEKRRVIALADGDGFFAEPERALALDDEHRFLVGAMKMTGKRGAAGLDFVVRAAELLASGLSRQSPVEITEFGSGG